MAKNTTPLEDEECRAFVEYLEAKRWRFTHIPNEGKFPVQYRVKLRDLGLRGGIADYVITHPVGLIFIEMKRTKGSRTSQNQLDWREALNKYPNIQSYICYGCDQAIHVLESLSNNKDLTRFF
ncbi:MAG: hypothetical protein KAS07_03075 [Candidatus Pacebacteria bacterium]|nr:hypothetical protein [Candidatus Paceibacterota bacterium]